MYSDKGSPRKPFGETPCTQLHQLLIRAGVSKSMMESQERCPENQRRQWYQEQYISAFGLSKNDLKFLDALSTLFLTGEVSYYNNGYQHYRSILEGHSWVVDLLEPNIPQLMSAGLIRFPRLNGDERYRLIHRTFFELTPPAKDIIKYDWAGEGIGDEGEGMVHRLGMWIAYFWLSETYGATERGCPDERYLIVNRYPTVNGFELDVAVRYIGGGIDGDPDPKTAVEIEADSLHMESTMNDIRKMGNACRDTIWVFPKREVLSAVVNEAVYRGVFEEMRPVPDTLALRGHRDTWTKRLKNAEPSGDLPIEYNPVRRVYTYEGLIDELRETRSDLFHDTTYGYRSDRERAQKDSD